MIYKTLFFILIATASFSAILFSWHGCFMFLEVKLEKKTKSEFVGTFLNIFTRSVYKKR
ncbi:hypothetical protein BSPWISOXPB_2367 [uncultured Gammaproteobacteria bacterium]|nr:hypothetical protein BSPWISOXPB_2367 [uncultured Gammaproteobacteria bacterium]